MIAACSTTTSDSDATAKAEINTQTKFSSAAYGVEASERVTTDRDVTKGGGRQMVGDPYEIAGKWYTPRKQPDYNANGLASWYGPNFHGRRTANGEIFDQYHLSAAHPTLPLPSYARVTNRDNGRSIIVRVNDRGPFAHGRIIDLSGRAADMLGFKSRGTARVNVQYAGPAELHGQDMAYLMASYREPGDTAPGIAPAAPVSAPGVMLAMNETSQPALPAAGSDASPSEADAPASALQTQARVQQAAATVSAVSGKASRLPSVGPVVPSRPATITSAQAYAQARIAGSAEPFDHVMAVPREQLTASAIADWGHRLR